MFFQNWPYSFTDSLVSVWNGVINFVPNLIVALVIFAIGWVLAMLIEKLVESIFKALRIDAALKSAGLEDVVKRAGHNLNSGVFVGALVKWFVIIVFLMASFEVLGLDQVNQFLSEVVNYLPQVIVAVLILMVGVLVANTMQRVVIASSRAANIKSAELLGRLTKWAIWIFVIIAALDKLVILPGLVQIVISPLLMGIALAFGLAFGLGGKESAQKLIDKTVHNVFE